MVNISKMVCFVKITWNAWKSDVLVIRYKSCGIPKYFFAGFQLKFI